MSQGKLSEMKGRKTIGANYSSAFAELLFASQLPKVLRPAVKTAMEEQKNLFMDWFHSP